MRPFKAGTARDAHETARAWQVSIRSGWRQAMNTAMKAMEISDRADTGSTIGFTETMSLQWIVRWAFKGLGLMRDLVRGFG